MDKIAVLIPCYNEAATIRRVVADFRAYLPDAVIYVYDNNSTDDTASIAADAGAVVRREYKQGKGNVIRRMFREIDAECYLMVDGDATYPADAAPAMCQYIFDKQADMVIGDRLSSTYFQENKRRFHSFGNRLVRYTINRLFHTNIRDIMTGFRAFSYHFVKTFPVLSCGFELEAEMTIHAVSLDQNIVNHIIDYKDRPAGSESKLNTCRDGFRVLLMILRLWKDARPLRFFSAIAAFLLLISIILLVPVFIEYFQRPGWCAVFQPSLWAVAADWLRFRHFTAVCSSPLTTKKRVPILSISSNRPQKNCAAKKANNAAFL